MKVKRVMLAWRALPRALAAMQGPLGLGRDKQGAMVRLKGSCTQSSPEEHQRDTLVPIHCQKSCSCFLTEDEK